VATTSCQLKSDAARKTLTVAFCIHGAACRDPLFPSCNSFYFSCNVRVRRTTSPIPPRDRLAERRRRARLRQTSGVDVLLTSRHGPRAGLLGGRSWLGAGSVCLHRKGCGRGVNCSSHIGKGGSAACVQPRRRGLLSEEGSILSRLQPGSAVRGSNIYRTRPVNDVAHREVPPRVTHATSAGRRGSRFLNPRNCPSPCRGARHGLAAA
jgi:hypothetical protein